MCVISYTRDAKCKDCRMVKSVNSGKRKMHLCGNPESANFGYKITLNDLACNKWKLE